MNVMRRTMTGVLAGVATASIVTALGPVLPARADDLPFVDRSARGSLGFCNQAGRPVTSGSLSDRPFTWTAVSSVPAPDGYATGKAMLLAYQPRQGVDPGEWSGSELTASSRYTNPAHPMAQATYADNPLLFFTQAYPPKWQGLVELRMYFSAVDKSVFSQNYPAAVIRVDGDRWSVVSPGSSVPCNVGRATSVEQDYLPASRLTSPAPSPTPGTGQPAAHQSGAGQGTTTGSADSSGARATSSDAPARAAAIRPAQSGAWGWPLAGAGLVALAIAGGAWAYRWHRVRSAVRR